MRVGFILDKSSSMLIPHNNVDSFDIGLFGIESFIKARRSAIVADSFQDDKYLLFYDSECVSSYFHPIEHFMFQINYPHKWPKPGSLNSALAKCLNLFNQYRILHGADNPYNGFTPSNIQPTMIIIFTDGGKIGTLDNVYNKIEIPKNLNGLYFDSGFRWDYRLYIVVVERQIRVSKSILSSYKKIVQYTGGKVLVVRSLIQIKLAMQELAQSIVPSFGINLEIKPNEKAKITKQTLTCILKMDLNRIRDKSRVNIECRHLSNSGAGLTQFKKESWPFPSPYSLPSSENRQIGRNGHRPNSQSKIEVISCFPLIGLDLKPKCFKILNSFPYDSYEVMNPECIKSITQILNITEFNIQKYENQYFLLKTIGTEIPFGALHISYNSNRFPNSFQPLIPSVVQPQSIETQIVDIERAGAKEYTSPFKIMIHIFCYNFLIFWSILDEYFKCEISKAQLEQNLKKFFQSTPFYYMEYFHSYLNDSLKLNFPILLQKLGDQNISENIVQIINKYHQFQKNLQTQNEVHFIEIEADHKKHQSHCCQNIPQTFSFECTQSIKQKQQHSKILRIPEKQYEPNLKENLPFHLLLHISKSLPHNLLTLHQRFKNLKLNEIDLDSSHKPKTTKLGSFHELPLRKMGEFEDKIKQKGYLRDYKFSDSQQRYLEDAYFGSPFRRVYDVMKNIHMYEGNLGTVQKEEDIIEMKEEVVDQSEYLSEQVTLSLPDSPEGQEDLSNTMPSKRTSNKTKQNLLYDPLIPSKIKKQKDIDSIKMSNQIEQAFNLENDEQINEPEQDTKKNKWNSEQAYLQHLFSKYLKPKKLIIDSTQPIVKIKKKVIIQPQTDGLLLRKIHFQNELKKYGFKILKLIRSFDKNSNDELFELLKSIINKKKFSHNYKDVITSFLINIMSQIRLYKPNPKFISRVEGLIPN